jgi:hypothetical protein
MSIKGKVNTGIVNFLWLIFHERYKLNPLTYTGTKWDSVRHAITLIIMPWTAMSIRVCDSCHINFYIKGIQALPGLNSIVPASRCWNCHQRTHEMTEEELNSLFTLH